MNQCLTNLLALHILAYIAHLCQHFRIELADVLAFFVEYVRSLNHIVAILIYVSQIVVLFNILAKSVVVVVAKHHSRVLSEIKVANRIHQECVGIEVCYSAFFHLLELIVGSKLASLKQSLHRSYLLVDSSLEFIPRQFVSIVSQITELNLVKIVYSLLIATLHSEGVVEIVGIKRDCHIVALLQIYNLELLAIIHVGIESIHTIELNSSLTVGKSILVDAHVVNQYHICKNRVLDIKLNCDAVGSLHIHSSKQQHQQRKYLLLHIVYSFFSL